MTPEGQVQVAILNYIRKLYNKGEIAYFEKRQAGGFSYKHGIPDVYFILPGGLHVEVEVKRPGGQLRADQEKWQERFEAQGIPYCCADSLQSFIIFLDELRLSRKL